MSRVTNALSVQMDVRRRFLQDLTEVAPEFASEFVQYFLTNKTSLYGIETDFLKALSHIKNISVLVRRNGDISVETADGLVNDFESYEEALSFAMEQITEKKSEVSPVEPPKGMITFATEIHAVNQHGEIKVYQGRPVIAADREAAQAVIDTYMPYQRLSITGNPLGDLTKKSVE